MIETAFIQTARSGDKVTCYHTSRECRYAKQCSRMHEISIEQAERRGLDVCPGPKCGDTQSPGGPTDPHATKRMLLEADPDTPFPVEGDS